MCRQLRVSLGQCSSAGIKQRNQDFHGALQPRGGLLQSKGIAIALADGISSSQVSHIASETAIKSFLEDYYATPEAWSVRQSVQRVVSATNSWLYAQTCKGASRFDKDRGYVCTFSALVIKGTMAHLFHAGDARVCHLSGNRLEPLTEEHRVWLGEGKSHLARAMGISSRLEIDYRSYAIQPGTILVLMTDGVYEFLDGVEIARLIRQQPDDLDAAAGSIVQRALAAGSDDNLTIQILRVDSLPDAGPGEFGIQAASLPFPPQLRGGVQLDGYRVIRQIHASARSHLFLARETDSGVRVVLKTPSVDLRDSEDYIERFLMEEWVARRLDNPHLMKAPPAGPRRSCLYTVAEYIEGQTLEQWMHDNPKPGLEQVRSIVEQIARGLRAMHRQEMLHQDLRPANIMIDGEGNVRLIDFGSVRVAGVSEGRAERPWPMLGTLQYSAPEYFLGGQGTSQSDLFSLGLIAYQMLSGRLPYGTRVASATSRSAQNRLVYRSVSTHDRPHPAWIDGALRKALQITPQRRYATLSEFLHDLRHPNPEFDRARQAPLMERDPLRFWQGTSLLLFIALLALLVTHPALQS